METLITLYPILRDLSTCIAHQFHIVHWINKEDICAIQTFPLDDMKWYWEHVAQHGYLKVIKWMCENKVHFYTSHIMDLAAKCGHLDIVRLLHKNKVDGCTKNAIDLAAYNGHFKVVKWLYKNKYETCTIDTMDCAASGGYLEIVRWLHYHGENCSYQALSRAAHNGHFEVVKWLYKNRTDCIVNLAIESAMEANRMKIVRWLRDEMGRYKRWC